MTTVAFDTETKGLDWFNPDQQAFLASWATDEGSGVVDLGDAAQVDDFHSILGHAEQIVCHNLPFDVHQLRATTGFDILADTSATLYDTDLMSRIAMPQGQRTEERGGHGLKNLAKLLIDPEAQKYEDDIKDRAKAIKTSLKKPGGYYDVWRAYPAIMEEYARYDAVYTLKLFYILSEKLTGELQAAYQLEQFVAPRLIRMEQRGIRLDPHAVGEQKDKYQAQHDETYEYLKEELGEAALGGEGSSEALTEALLAIGVPLTKLTASNKLATNKFALAPFMNDFKQLEKLEEYRQASKFLSTYIEPMVDRDTVNPSFRSMGAWTSRMSCVRPNMQNIPKRAGKEVRSMFVPREGYCFVVSDYDAIEIRLLAYYLNDTGFIDLIDAGHDPHAWMCAHIHGGADVQYLKVEDGGTPEGEALRDEAKNTLFAITYGAGAPRVSNMNGISKDEAKTLISKIKASIPRYYHLSSRIRKKIERDGYVTTLYGNKQLVSKDKAYVGLNAIIQGSAAGIMKRGFVLATDGIAEYDAHPILVVHDELVTECPIENAEKVQAIQDIAMVQAGDELGLKPRLAVTSKIVTTNYSEG